MKHVFSFLFVLFFQFAAAQWKYADFPNGGKVLSMTPKQDLLFASVGEDVFKSADKGDSWQISGNGLPKSDSVFLCASDNKVFAATRKGLYASADNGATWAISGTLPDSVSHRISSIAAQGKVVLAGAPYGRIYRSEDEGTTWQLVYSKTFTGGVRPIVINNNIAIAGVFNGLVYSRDLGKTWTIAANVPAIQPVFTFYKTKIIAEFLEDIYVSADSGSTWNYQTNDLPMLTEGLTMTTDDSILYLGTTKGLFTSSDAGETWTEEISGLPYRSHVNVFTWLKNGLFMGTSKSIFYSADRGKNWVEKSTGLQRIQVNTLTTNGNRVLSGCGSGLMTSDNNNLKWDYKLFGLTGNAGVFYYDTLDTLLFAATGDNIFVSSDKGENWDEKNKGIPSSDAYTTQIKNNAGTLYTPHMTDGLYRSADRGENWEWINGDLPATVSVTKVGFHNTIIFIAVNNQGIYKSLNGGINWTAAHNGLPSVIQINEISTIAGVVFLATDKGLYKSIDDGLNWSSVAGVPSQSVNTIAEVDKYILLGMYGEIFLSSDQGISWRPVGNGLPEANVNAFTVNANLVYAATGQGVWYCALNEVGIKENINAPDILIYPNPAEGLFQISSAYPELHIEVNNAMGEKIMETDFHQSLSQLDLMHLSKGVYILKISTKGQMVTAKKILIQ